MYILITAFYLSLLGIITMIFLKRSELKKGEVATSSQFGQKTEERIHKIFAAIRHFFSYINKHTFIAITQWIAYHILLRIRNVYVEIKHKALINPHTKKVIDMVRGRGEIKDHGASLYLRRIEK